MDPRRIKDALAALLLAGACAGLPLWLATEPVPDVEVRSVPWRTHGGRLPADRPTGQGFRCRWDGLRVIDVALVALAPPGEAEVELTLRGDDPGGTILRRARARPGPLEAPGEFVAFSFEPIERSAGRRFWFELRPVEGSAPSPFSAWVRFHGQPGHDATWGHRIVTGPVIEGALADHARVESQQDPGNVPHAHLRAVAVAADHLAAHEGTTRLELWPEGGTGEPLRTVELGAEQGIHGGWAFFSFPPIPDSRWERYRFRLTLPQTARLVGLEQGLSLKTFHGLDHGLDGAASRLAGTSLAGVVHADRDLLFRAWSSPDRAEVAALVGERAGWRLAAAALAWILATFLVLRLARTVADTERNRRQARP
ncbi:MAG: hypothetical protein QF903_07025 [Planctomycetota bacterium]|jgi:hypothetical protein|nr:hypothetical protein [Planctomycetota bacterium]MDP6762033.1 hypothetical protein [Planctomycetota bacterium]MDP6989216.1 hypothetical protein [Planctomycetota bacterium]